MAVLESPDLDKRYAEQSLRFLANDKSVQKFDQILLAEQVTAGTRIAMPGGMGVVIA